MKNVLILGAGGQIARWVIEMLANSGDINLTLFLRHGKKLKAAAPKNARIVHGDVLDAKQLSHAVAGQDIVYANLSGDVDAQAANIVKAMKAAGVHRLIFVTS